MGIASSSFDQSTNTKSINLAKLVENYPWVKLAEFKITGGIHPDENKKISSESPANTTLLDRSDVDRLGVDGFGVDSPVVDRIVIDKLSADENLNDREACELPTLPNWHIQTPEALLAQIQKAGIVGLGGAGFPTHKKLNTGSQVIDTLIVNAMECEPYITCDDRLIREHAAQIIEGALIEAFIVKAKRICFAVEDNKPAAIFALTKAIESTKKQTRVPLADLSLEIIISPTIYPSGGEKQTIQIVTGKQVPSGKYPASIGILVQNVGTLYAIVDAVVCGQQLTKRLVTLSGDQLKHSGNYWLPIGVSVKEIFAQLDITLSDKQQLVIGGPMMGIPTNIDQAIVDKTTNCLLVVDRDTRSAQKPITSHAPCIRCGDCIGVCPASLLPDQLYRSTRAEQWSQLQDAHLNDCIECGACSYVCPSSIPLVSYYQYAKTQLKESERKKAFADKAKIRFERREQRLVRLKKEKEEKHKRAAEERRAAVKNQSHDPEGKKAAIAAALSRVKKKAPRSKNTANLSPSKVNEAANNPGCTE